MKITPYFSKSNIMKKQKRNIFIVVVAFFISCTFGLTGCEEDFFDDVDDDDDDGEIVLKNNDDIPSPNTYTWEETNEDIE